MTLFLFRPATPWCSFLALLTALAVTEMGSAAPVLAASLPVALEGTTNSGAAPQDAHLAAGSAAELDRVAASDQASTLRGDARPSRTAAANSPRRVPVSPARLERLFQQAKAEFWSVEPTFNNYDNPIKSLPPLTADSSEAIQYRHAGQVAEAFLSVQEGAGQKDGRTPVMLYVGAMAYSRIGADEAALTLINRLLSDYPDYRYPRQTNAAQFDRPVRGTLLHLKLYHLNRILMTQLRQQAAEQARQQKLAAQQLSAQQLSAQQKMVVKPPPVAPSIPQPSTTTALVSPARPTAALTPKAGLTPKAIVPSPVPAQPVARAKQADTPATLPVPTLPGPPLAVPPKVQPVSPVHSLPTPQPLRKPQAASAAQAAPMPKAPPIVQAAPTPHALPAPLNQPPLQALAAIAQDGADAFAEEGALRESAGFEGALEYSAPTPDQLRSAALPEVGTLVMQLHDILLPRALQKDGPKAVRDYLRTLAGSGKPFAGYAYLKLLDIDRGILAQYQGEADKARSERRWGDAKAWLQKIMAEYEGFPAGIRAKEQLSQVVLAEYQDEAQQAMAQYRFADARALYRRIIAEYAGTAAAQQAQVDLLKTVPVAVSYYKAQGDKSYQPDDQPGIPQTQAREDFQKMYEEDPDGPQADYALLQWSRALGTESKPQEAIAHLLVWVDKFPNSPLRPQAMFLLGFMYGGQHTRKRDQAIQWMQRVVQEYPDSEEAPEALCHMAFFYAWTNKQYAPAIACLQQLQQKYPQSPRVKHIPEWIHTFQQDM